MTSLTPCDELGARDDQIELRAAEIYERTFWSEPVETASWASALEHELTARVDACREQARRELAHEEAPDPDDEEAARQFEADSWAAAIEERK